MIFYIAQAAGILSTAAAVCCVQARQAKFIILGQFLANAFSAICYGLLGSLSGAWVCILASVHSLVAARANRHSGKKRLTAAVVVSVLFACAYLLGTVVTYSRWPDLISGVCALLFVVTIIQKDASKMRGIMLLSMSLWVIFDVVVGAYANIISHGMTILSILTARARLDK